MLERKKMSKAQTLLSFSLPPERFQPGSSYFKVSHHTGLETRTKRSNCQSQEAVKGLDLEGSPRLNIFLN